MPEKPDEKWKHVPLIGSRRSCATVFVDALGELNHSRFLVLLKPFNNTAKSRPSKSHAFLPMNCLVRDIGGGDRNRTDE